MPGREDGSREFVSAGSKPNNRGSVRPRFVKIADQEKTDLVIAAKVRAGRRAPFVITLAINGCARVAWEAYQSRNDWVEELVIYERDKKSN